MGALSWSHDRSPNHRHGRLGIHPGILLWVVNTEEAQALFEKLSASERESEEHGLKENSCHTLNVEFLKFAKIMHSLKNF
jgi:hypothetical protein